MKKVIFIVGAFVAFSAFSVMDNISNWRITDGYSIKFSNSDATGVFSKFSGDIVFDENSPEQSSFNVTIDAASINTGNGMKNRHAKSDKWLDAEQFPAITFTSSSISKTSNSYEAKGILSLHGFKKEISFPFTFVNNVFAGSFTINRLDYGIGGTKGMSGKVPAELQLDINVPVTKK